MPEHSSGSRPINILLVEDDDDDFDLIIRALKKDRILNSLSRVVDGVHALEYLRRQGQFSDATRPDLILLDLNMPRMGGREVLKEVKEDPNLMSIPIVVFISSDDERDVLANDPYQANSYVTKPVDLVKFRNILKEIQEYWFCMVTVPPNDGDDN